MVPARRGCDLRRARRDVRPNQKQSSGPLRAIRIFGSLLLPPRSLFPHSTIIRRKTRRHRHTFSARRRMRRDGKRLCGHTRGLSSAVCFCENRWSIPWARRPSLIIHNTRGDDGPVASRIIPEVYAQRRRSSARVPYAWERFVVRFWAV